ncbi:MAG: dienelactone hydrolase family protein [Alphaproteobacteria bacterium]
MSEKRTEGARCERTVPSSRTSSEPFSPVAFGNRGGVKWRPLVSSSGCPCPRSPLRRRRRRLLLRLSRDAESPGGPGIVVIQEIFGVNAGIRAIADRLAAKVSPHRA